MDGWMEGWMVWMMSLLYSDLFSITPLVIQCKCINIKLIIQTSIYLSTYVHVCIHVSIYLFIYLSMYLLHSLLHQRSPNLHQIFCLMKWMRIRMMSSVPNFLNQQQRNSRFGTPLKNIFLSVCLSLSVSPSPYRADLSFFLKLNPSYIL